MTTEKLGTLARIHQAIVMVAPIVAAMHAISIFALTGRGTVTYTVVTATSTSMRAGFVTLEAPPCAILDGTLAPEGGTEVS